MKKAILTIFLISGIWSYSQSKFTYNEKGLTPEFIVTKIDSLSKEQLYSKVIDWIKETYKNPDKVIKAKFENKKIRFSGFQSGYLKSRILMTTSYQDIKYTIEVSVKDGRYKFEPINLESYSESSKYSIGGWYPISLEYGKAYYKKNGKIRKMFKEYPKSIATLFNGIEATLNIYLLKQNNTIKDKKEDW